MEFNVSPAENGQYIVTTVLGEITRDLAGQFIGAAVETGAQLNLGRHLFDVTRARNTETVIGNIRVRREDVPEIAPSFKEERIAVLAAPKDHSHDFFVAFAQSQGLDINLFWDREEAIAHLTHDVQASAKPGCESA